MASRRLSKKVQAAARWQISRIAGRAAVHLGEVEAPDADAAIRTAIEKYDVAPEFHSRVMARPIVQ